jgi:hypothetical protein
MSKISSEKDPSLVVALTIVDGKTLVHGKINDDSMVLFGVRSDTNPVQPGVISSPTQRAPNSVLDEIIKDHKVPALLTDYNLPVYASQCYFLSDPFNDPSARGHNPSIYAVNSVFAAKLGVANPLERGEIKYSCSPAGLVFGYVLHNAGHVRPGQENKGNGSSHKEWHNMANILVAVWEGFELFPKRTEAYDPIFQLNVAGFEKRMRNLHKNEIAPVDPSDNYKMGGLCVLSSYVTLQNCLLNNITITGNC